jgi:transposase
MRFRHSRVNVDGHGIGQIAWLATAATMRQESGLRTRGILPLLARRRTAHGSGLGRWRWVVERTFAWVNQFRRLRVRYEKRADIHEAFLSLACALICWHALRKSWMPG